jgi:hypothetical protein
MTTAPQSGNGGGRSGTGAPTRVWVLLAAALTLISCGTAGQDSVPRPVLPDGPLPLRVVYLENPRLDPLSSSEILELLASARGTVERHFGLVVAFGPVETRGLPPLFRDLDRRLEPELKHLVADVRGGDVDWTRVESAIAEDLGRSPEPTDEVWRYAEAFAEPPLPDARTHTSLAALLARTMKARVRQWTALRGLDGQPLVGGPSNDPPLNEWVYWDSLARRDFPWEIAVTNQLVASVEYASVPPHAALRGGITLGGTSSAVDSRYGTFSWVSVFPFLSADPAIVALRGGASYSRAEAIRLAGVLLAHEIGHQLLHLAHPWGNIACVMTPPRLLLAREWDAALDPAACPIGSSPAMTPGAAWIERLGPLP